MYTIVENLGDGANRNSGATVTGDAALPLLGEEEGERAVASMEDQWQQEMNVFEVQCTQSLSCHFLANHGLNGAFVANLCLLQDIIISTLVSQTQLTEVNMIGPRFWSFVY